MKKLLTQNQQLDYLILLIFLIVSFFFDRSIINASEVLRLPFIDGFMMFLTDFGFIFFILVLIVQLIRHRHFKVLALFLIACALAFEAGFILKLFFQVPRPYFDLEVAVTPLKQVSGYSFPSIHTSLAFAIIPFLDEIFIKQWKRWLTLAVICLIAFSRLYLGVHYFSDILAGAMIGYFISLALHYFQEKYHFFKLFHEQIKDKLELRRQIAHLITGLTIVFLLYVHLLNAQILFAILVLGGLLSMLHRFFQFPILNEILTYFEREKDIKSFPGRGSFFLVAGATAVTALFPLGIALAAITIMAIGDSVSHLIGRYFGRIPVPFLKHKNIEGTVLAIALSTLGALTFVSLQQAFAASLFAMLVEAYWPSKWTRIIDDNLFIPILAALIMILI